MARSHHRKKHKQHLQQFKHRGERGATQIVGKSSAVFIIGGAVFGFLIGYMASSGDTTWMIGGLLLGGIGGYLLGKKIDNDRKEDPE